MTITLNRRQMLAALGATTAAAGLPFSALAQTQAVRIGTSSVGSVFYTLAIGAGEVISEHAGINTTVEPVGGSAANINGLVLNNIDLSINNSFSAYSGLTGQYGFPEPFNIRLLIQGQPSYRWIFVREGSGIETPADLNGRTIIGERRALPELRLLLDAFIEHFGLDASSMNIVETNETTGAIEAIRVGSVDAVILPFSPRAGQIEEPMLAGAMKFLQVTPEDRDAMLELLPAAFYGVDQPADDFSNQPDVVPLISLNTYLISDASLDDELAYQVVKALFDNHDEFVSYHGTARDWTVENTLRSPAVPFHPGAVRYFEETGVWTEELAATQEELLNT
jgi:TRAP transporter TAXI family solute receptor